MSDAAPGRAVRASQCSIILVHGTWGRGFFPRISDLGRRKAGARRWFEDHSPFRASLDAALHSALLDWPIRPFLWSGANSVHARDCAARELADELRRDLEDPGAQTIIIAHSHGGNVALRALQHLDSAAGRIRVVTLATPFLRVFARKPLPMNFTVVLLLWAAISLAVLFGVSRLFGVLRIIWPEGPPANFNAGTPLFLVLVFGILLLVSVSAIFIVRWLNELFPKSDRALEIESAAFYDTCGRTGPRMLVIRGVDDEASLALAAGAIGARLTSLLLRKIVPSIFLIGLALLAIFSSFLATWEPQVDETVWMYGCALVTLMLFFLPGLFKSAFGREFLLGAMVCDIAVDSVPDTSGLAQAITLPPVEAISFGEMRHYIYDHPTCVDKIVGWLSASHEW
jgi:hypothetical protein